MRIIVLQTVSTSFAYVAITAIIIVLMFVIIMDVLKYCFGIDPAKEERERIRKRKHSRIPPTNKTCPTSVHRRKR